MSTTFTIFSKDSPPALKARIVGATPVTESTCRISVTDFDGNVIVAERVVSGTLVENGISYFDVKLTLAECDLLVPGEYVYAVQVESTSVEFRQESVYTLRVKEHYVAV